MSCLILVVACVVQTYHDTMHKLCLMSADELQQIFGPLYQLLPLHEGHYYYLCHYAAPVNCLASFYFIHNETNIYTAIL